MVLKIILKNFTSKKVLYFICYLKCKNALPETYKTFTIIPFPARTLHDTFAASRQNDALAAIFLESRKNNTFKA